MSGGWLERRSTWQFALIWGVCIFLPILLGGGVIQWFAKGHIDFSFLLGYGLVFTVLSGIPAAYKQRLRQPAPDDNQSNEPEPPRQ